MDAYVCITGNLQIFWSNDDLDMIEESSLYQETIKQKTQIEEDFLEIKPVSNFFFFVYGQLGFLDSATSFMIFLVCVLWNADSWKC